MFSDIVSAYWFGHVLSKQAPRSSAAHHLIVDNTLPTARRLLLLEAMGHAPIQAVSPAMATQRGLETVFELEDTPLLASMRSMGPQSSDADNLYYFPTAEQAVLRASSLPASTTIRRLTTADAP